MPSTSESNDKKASSDSENPLLSTNENDAKLDNLLKGISNDIDDDSNDQESGGFFPGRTLQYHFLHVLQILQHTTFYFNYFLYLAGYKTLYLTLPLLSLDRNSTIWG
jgi:hypothetical protein